MGATIGPYAGGLLGAEGDYYLGAKLAAAGSMLSVVLSLFLPGANRHEKGTNRHDKGMTNHKKGTNNHGKGTNRHDTGPNHH